MAFDVILGMDPEMSFLVGRGSVSGWVSAFDVASGPRELGAASVG